MDISILIDRDRVRVSKKTMKYYKREWKELRGDCYDNWGTSIWWFEVDGEGYVIRNIQEYANGKNLFYSETHMEDKYGFLPEGTLDLEEFAAFEITKEEFEAVIKRVGALNDSST